MKEPSSPTPEELSSVQLATILEGVLESGKWTPFYVEKIKAAFAQAARAVPSETRAINQCDGCRRGLRTRVSAMGAGSILHVDERDHAVMACTKDRYEHPLVDGDLATQREIADRAGGVHHLDQEPLDFDAAVSLLRKCRKDLAAANRQACTSVHRATCSFAPSATNAPPIPETSQEVHDTLIDAERYRWFRNECDWERRIVIAEYAEDGGQLDHHIDKARCGL